MNVYADNAATTRLCRRAWEAMAPYWRDFYGNPSSLHRAGQRAKEAIENARDSMASRLGTSPRDILFTSGGSESDTQAIRSAAMTGWRSGKRHVVSTAFEHPAVLHTLDKLREKGFDVTLVSPGKDGVVDAKVIERAIRPDTCLVSVMYANNEIGTLQPVPEISAICHSRGVLFHTDAVQAVGHVPIDIRKEGIDLLSLSAHKFHGPKGIGALVVRQGIVLETIIEGGGQERERRGGTENVPAIVGMAAALDDASSRMEETGKSLAGLQDRLIEGLSAIPGSTLNGHRVKRLPGIVNFTFEGVEGEALLLYLDGHGICASAGSACASGSREPSHVLTAIGKTRDEGRNSLRISLSRYNTQEEIDYLVYTITQGVSRLRGLSPLWRKRKEFPCSVTAKFS